ncbi:MAG: 2-isopropylmalate synthase [Acidobacteria bacterium]|nr:MAG: 2-isopropylmalate synthase [Acidobacteriota bacterium]
MEERQLIYDWNNEGGANGAFDWTHARVDLNDETLRDGLQSPSVTDPTLDVKRRLLHLMADLGIVAADIGLPGAGPRVVDQVRALATEIRDQRLPIAPNCAARTVITDIEPIVRVSDEVGIKIEAATFIGSSPIRQYTEDWTVDRIVAASEEAVTYAVKHGLPVMYVTEDTTRARPETLKALYGAAIACGAGRICLADTVGHATPDGVRALVKFVKEEIVKKNDVKIDWHGHRDRGFGVASSIAALEAGATRLHGAALGIGERCGNTPIDLLMVNLVMMGYRDNDLSSLPAYAQAVAAATDVRIAPNYPVIGADAFRTATGVHAAAVVKAFRKGDRALMDAVYAAVPASLVGRQQEIEVGPMSGRSNVIFWLESRGLRATDEIVDRIFAAAKASDRTLTHEQVQNLAGGDAKLKPAGAKLETARRKGF